MCFPTDWAADEVSRPVVVCDALETKTGLDSHQGGERVFGDA